MTSPSFPEPPRHEIPPTPVAELDALVDKLHAKKDAWVKTTLAQRIAYLEKILDGVGREAPGWSAALSGMKGLTGDGAGEDWLAGPLPTVRNLRLLIEALEQGGQPKPPGLRQRKDGQWIAEVMPGSLHDRLLYAGWHAEVWIEPGKPPSQGRIYREKQGEGVVGLVLGAGNVASIAPTDVLYKMFVENEVCVLKMNPVNEVGGPFVARAFQCLIDDGYFGVVYGGAEVGKHLTDHPKIGTIHMTGSDRTHDAIVWGGSAEEQKQNKAKGTPRLNKPVSSELGCVTPVLVVPGPWTDDEIAYQARNVCGMVTQNASFNCAAAKVIVTAKGWDRSAAFLSKLEDALRAAPARKAYYPGAEQRFEQFVKHYPSHRVLGEQKPGAVPWTVIPDVPAKKGEYALSNEAFCGVLALVSMDAGDAKSFLDKAIPFVNDEVWGSLSMIMLIHPKTQKELGAGFEDALAALRYGGITVNGWTGADFGLGCTTWGAFPGHPMDDIQSGRGVVHNTFLFDHPQKSVVYLPFTIPPANIVWAADHKNLKGIGEKLTRYEAHPSLLKLPGLLKEVLKG